MSAPRSSQSSPPSGRLSVAPADRDRELLEVGDVARDLLQAGRAGARLRRLGPGHNRRANGLLRPELVGDPELSMLSATTSVRASAHSTFCTRRRYQPETRSIESSNHRSASRVNGSWRRPARSQRVVSARRASSLGIGRDRLLDAAPRARLVEVEQRRDERPRGDVRGVVAALRARGHRPDERVQERVLEELPGLLEARARGSPARAGSRSRGAGTAARQLKMLEIVSFSAEHAKLRITKTKTSPNATSSTAESNISEAPWPVPRRAAAAVPGFVVRISRADLERLADSGQGTERSSARLPFARGG